MNSVLLTSSPTMLTIFGKATRYCDGVARRSFLPNGVVGATGGHDAVQCMSGWTMRDMASVGGHPSMGAYVSKLLGPVDPSVPPFVGLAAPTQHRPWSDSGAPGFLGAAYAPFKPEGAG